MLDCQKVLVTVSQNYTHGWTLGYPDNTCGCAWAWPWGVRVGLRPPPLPPGGVFDPPSLPSARLRHTHGYSHDTQVSTRGCSFDWLSPRLFDSLKSNILLKFKGEGLMNCLYLSWFVAVGEARIEGLISFTWKLMKLKPFQTNKKFSLFIYNFPLLPPK